MEASSIREILDSFGIKNPVRCGSLKYINFIQTDVGKHPIKRACNFLRKLFPDFIIDYCPEIKGDALFVTDDVAPGNRRLVSRAITQGIKTFVVQHGALQNPHGFVPLYADYFLCWPECVDKCIHWGMEPDRVIPFIPEPPSKLNYIPNIKSVLFLLPPVKGRHHHSIIEHYDENELYEIAKKVLRWERSRLVIKPHPKLWEYLAPLCKKLQIVWYNAYDLIYSADRIFCMKGCTTIKDCEVLGKKPIIL